MTKEDLLELKMKLSKLSEEEQKKRNLYLRDLASGELQGPPTGYPSIDKPWLKHYDFSKLDYLDIKKTVYQEVYDNNLPYQKELALEFFGTKISYKKFFDNIQKAVKALKEYGVKKGDYVSFCIAGIPETAYLFYACSYIGAIGNFMTPNMYMEDMEENVNISESKIFFVMDKFYEKISPALKNTNVDNIVIIPTLNSSLLKYISPKFKIVNSNELFWNQFIKDGKHKELETPVDYEKNSPLVVVYSSGTTGRYKGILLSNDSFQNSVHSYPSVGVDISRNQKFYQIIPPWVSTGLSTSLHLPLTYGVSVFMDPRFEREPFVKNIINHKINYAVATTSMYEGFLDENLVKNKTWPFINYPFQGGEALPIEKQEKIDEAFKKHGCDAKIRSAYGQCECGAAIVTQTQKIDHPKGSSGIPLPGINIAIFDDEKNELGFNTRGNIVVDTPCGMLKYFNNDELTEEYFYTDKQGVKWSQTGDVGYIDQNGDLFIEGRSKDYTIVNNHKVYNFDIEKIILQDSRIKDCDVVARTNGENQELFAHIIYVDEIANNKDFNIEENLKEIQERIYHYYDDVNMVPNLFKIRTEFPCAMSGKRDVRAMQQDNDNVIFLNSKELVKTLKKVKSM